MACILPIINSILQFLLLIFKLNHIKWTLLRLCVVSLSYVAKYHTLMRAPIKHKWACMMHLKFKINYVSFKSTGKSGAIFIKDLCIS